MSDQMDELVAEAKEAGVKSPHLFKDPEKLKAKIAEAKAPVKEPPAPPAPPEPKEPEQVVFYWKDNQNLSRICGRKKVGGVLQNAGQLYKSKKSVLRLISDIDFDAIKELRAHKDNTANGGTKFSEIKDNESIESSMGDRLEELMELEQPALAEMVGGGPINSRKSKPQLIAELIKA